MTCPECKGQTGEPWLPSYSSGRNVKWRRCCVKQPSWWFLKMLNIASHHMIQKFHSIPKKIENICPHKTLYTNVHSSIIDYRQKVEQIRCPEWNLYSKRSVWLPGAEENWGRWEWLPSLQVTAGGCSIRNVQTYKEFWFSLFEPNWHDMNQEAKSQCTEKML